MPSQELLLGLVIGIIAVLIMLLLAVALTSSNGDYHEPDTAFVTEFAETTPLPILSGDELIEGYISHLNSTSPPSGDQFFTEQLGAPYVGTR